VENKFTDNEIMKALECCGVNRDCAGCPKEKEPYGCYFVLCGGALDLINRQKAMIDGLIAGQETLQKALCDKNAEMERLQEHFRGLTKKVESEARKEFAERLKQMVFFDGGWEVLQPGTIDNLVKEMEGKDGLH